MIKFFRHIRQMLIDKNRLGKYLLYAIGEIFLVVIGIFIALSLNNWNDQRRKQEKVDVILMDILDEIDLDIEKINDLTSFYRVKDSAIFLLMNGKVTRSDYEQYSIPGLWDLTTLRSTADLTRNGYDHLLRSLDDIPTHYGSALKALDELYNQKQPPILYLNQELGTIAKSNLDHRAKNFEWFSRTKPAHQSQMINYLVDDFRYINEVRIFETYGLGNHLVFSIDYRMKALDTYKAIADLIGHNPVPPNVSKYSNKLGNGQYTIDEFPGLVLTNSERDGRFFTTNNLDESEGEVFWFAQNRLITSNAEFFTVVYQNGDTLAKSNLYTLRRLKTKE